MYLWEKNRQSSLKDSNHDISALIFIWYVIYAWQLLICTVLTGVFSDVSRYNSILLMTLSQILIVQRFFPV